MQQINYTFKRYETKYHIPKDILPAFRKRLEEHMALDEYGKTTILNLYYDTKEHELISRSLEKPKYKEKIRLRSYGVPTRDSLVFMELKKKYAGVVYKRRSSMLLGKAETFLSTGDYAGEPSQIDREIAYFVQFYHPKPAMMLAYEREAFFEKGSDLRLTLDSGIRCREQDLSLTAGDAGLILEPDTVLLEIKAAGAIPLWLVHLLSQYHLYPTSFSKYGFAYSHLHHKKVQIQREDFYVHKFA